MRRGGGIRLDHAMQVFRLWWVPRGASPADGAYVEYDADALLSILVEEATAAGVVVVGEDLGTVEPYMRDAFAARGVLGTSMAWFERGDDGGPLPAECWRRSCLATVGTHDMPPIAGYVRGDHIDLRERLGLLARPASLERAELAENLSQWRALLGLPDDASAEDMIVAFHRFLARTPSVLRGASLADVVGDRRTQNQPGTVDEYPNWRVPLSGPDGRPYLLDDLPGDPRARAAVEAIAGD
jgi:4-alpha-glucanotransferase